MGKENIWCSGGKRMELSAIADCWDGSYEEVFQNRVDFIGIDLSSMGLQSFNLTNNFPGFLLEKRAYLVEYWRADTLLLDILGGAILFVVFFNYP